jgi:GNAT superfamily N-acetyltransferase
MTPVRIRPFARADRDQLADLVNGHLAAVTPGLSLSVQALLSHLEREPGEIIVDPWVIERITLVAEQRHRIVAAAHLLRYGGSDEVGEHYRDAGEIRWLVSALPASFWPDAEVAGAALMRACVAQLDAWRVRVAYADGGLPGPGVYGVPDVWPHVRRLYEDAGFSGSRTETVLIGRIEEVLAQPVTPPSPAAVVRRSVGINGVRFTGSDGGVDLGYVEVDTGLGEPGRFVRGIGWADVGNIQVDAAGRSLGVPAWLLHAAARWLDLGGFGRLLAYVSDDDEDASIYAAAGFTELTTTIRDYTRRPAGSIG